MSRADERTVDAQRRWLDTAYKRAFGIEGAGSYGATLTSFPRRAGHKVVEAGRPDRRLRRMNGKSDTLDAENAARAVLAGFATATPKTADGEAEMIRQLKIAHDQAVEQRAAAMVTIKAILVHASDALRRETAGKTQISLARQLAALRPRRLEGPEDALRHTLRTLAERWQYLDAEAKELTMMIGDLVQRVAPQLLEPRSSGRRRRARPEETGAVDPTVQPWGPMPRRKVSTTSVASASAFCRTWSGS
ncbi:IS110 family transposase [Streptomyces sp. 3214.6]|uniref:IS110 family transposase n=1 Tax=Streptomyces sp. 3214.6 TaxID=1882757 RepID=UPI0018D55F50|nr:hypothetical protein [Streptomyces sp. 3214.6]